MQIFGLILIVSFAAALCYMSVVLPNEKNV